MREEVSFFSADYMDGMVHIGGRKYSSGHFASVLLDDFYNDDLAARIIVFRQAIWNSIAHLRYGYLVDTDFLKAGEDILYMLKHLKRLRPFDLLDIEGERQRVTEMFTEDTVETIIEYFRQMSQAAYSDFGFTIYTLCPPGYDEDFCREAAKLLDSVRNTLRFYDRLGEDLMEMYDKLKEFTDRVDEADRFDEAHLLPIAIEIFNPSPQDVKIEYIPRKKTKRSKTATVARRMYFGSYGSFILTDLFEGLHYGHYPRQCDMCRRYFLMTTAHFTLYCNGYAKELYRGKKITCRSLAAQLSRKEQAEDNPVIIRYKNRCGAIRTEEGRGTVTKELAAAAKKLAKEHEQLAIADPDYARTQYIRDMEHDRLYEDAKRRMNQGPGS